MYLVTDIYNKGAKYSYKVSNHGQYLHSAWNISLFLHNYFFTFDAVIRSVLKFFITKQHQIFVSKKQHDD